MQSPQTIEKTLTSLRRQGRLVCGLSFHFSRLDATELGTGYCIEQDEIGALLARNRFTSLGDFRLTHESQKLPQGNPRRVFVSTSGEIAVLSSQPDVIHPKYLLLDVEDWPLRAFECFTEFEDGGFLFTSTLETTFGFTMPRSIRRVALPADSPWLRILRTHRTELAAQKQKGRVSLKITDETALTASVHRFQAKERDHRRRSGFARVGEARAFMRMEKERAIATAALTARYDHAPRMLASIQKAKARPKDRTQ